MAITLRAYNREIENLISAGQLETADRHCRHILKIFPAHLDTNRQLARTLLGLEHYPQSAEHFQRVLESVPDDYTANFGMSMIREKAGDLEGSVWYMERAFETQPGSAEVKDRLRTLYAARSGAEQSSIRLTPGALANMFYQHQLYSLGINEIEGIVRQDPRRVDMLLLLARCYSRTDQIEAEKKSYLGIVERYPLCQEANRVLAELYDAEGLQEQADLHRQCLRALDPYSAFVPGQFPRENLVPDQAVVLEWLDIDRGSVEVIPANDPANGDQLQVQASSHDQSGEWIPEVVGDPDLTPKAAAHALGRQPDQPGTGDLDAAAESALEGNVGAASVPDAPTTEAVELPDWLVESGAALFAMQEAAHLGEDPSELPADTVQQVEDENMKGSTLTGENGKNAGAAVPEIVAPADQAGVATPASGPDELLNSARTALFRGNVRDAMDQYSVLIATNERLPEVIRDLQEALRRPVVQALLWKGLAEAHENAGQVKEALAAYKKVVQIWWE